MVKKGKGKWLDEYDEKEVLFALNKKNIHKLERSDSFLCQGMSHI